MKGLKINLKYESEPLFTADWHYGHGKIITWPPRNERFQTITEHNQTILDLYVEEVNKHKTTRAEPRVFILGDMFLRTHNQTIHKVLEKIPGRKYLIKGNHCEWYTDREYRRYFEDVSLYKDVRIVTKDGSFIDLFLCHFAMRTFNKSHYGSINLHGHSHSNLNTGPFFTVDEEQNVHPVHYKAVDVGVDCWNYKPITLQKILCQLSKQNLKNLKTLEQLKSLA